MTLKYINSEIGKLISLHRHDYKSDGRVFIDGGFDYTRTNTTVHEDTIENLIGDIREVFTWTANYDKDMNRREKPMTRLLKDLDTDHIINILIYFTDSLSKEAHIDQTWKAYHLIFLTELKYRFENNLI